MKPNQIPTKHGRQFPVTDFHYQSSVFHGGCSNGSTDVPSRAFWKFSRDYFGVEAQRSFATDAAVFGALLATVAVSLIQNVSAIGDLLRAFTA
jgi:hypothetical protein